MTFRFPAYVNGRPDGLLIEAAAGLLDADDPETVIRRKAQEESDVTVVALDHVLDACTSPGSVTERLHFSAAAWRPRGGRARLGCGVDE